MQALELIFPVRAVPSLALYAALAASLCTSALAQQVQDLNLSGVPPDLISAHAPPSGPLAAASAPQELTAQPLAQQSVMQQSNRIAPVQLGPAGKQPHSATAATPAQPAPVSLGQDLSQTDGTAQADTPDAAADGVPSPGLAERAAQAAAKPPSAKSRLRRADKSAAAGPAERVVFDRVPLRVPLPLGVERLITLPAAVALHVPDDMDKVARIQNIERTLYVTALVPFTPIRVIAELVDSGQQIPLDLVADKSTAASTGELQVSVLDPHGGADGAPGPAAQATPNPSGIQTTGLDMVQLTRYAAHQLYAPARLAYRLPGVTQIKVAQVAQPTLIRGVDAQIVPLGEWRSGPLYVTAVRVTNRSRYALEIPLEQLRGSWIAATAQHGRIGPAGSDTDTTAIYLVSDRPFEACL